MVARHRERDLRVGSTGQFLTWSGSTPTVVSTITKLTGKEEICDDRVGDWTEVNPFQKSTKSTYYPSLTGKFYSGSPPTLTQEFVAFPIQSRPGPTDPYAGFPQFSNAELNNYAWRILAETNPSTPHVGVPAALGELKDLVPAIKTWGEGLLRLAKGKPPITPQLLSTLRSSYGLNAGGLARAGAAGFLTWQWCVKPMMDDLRKLYSFMDGANQRLRELENLRTGKTLRRRCHLGKQSLVGARNARILHTQGTGIDGWRTVHYSREIWGTCQYKLARNSPVHTMSDEELKYFSRQLAGGFTTYGALDAAWQLMPWSWMADWMSNTDDLIAANNNSIGLTWEKIALMAKTKSVSVYEINQATRKFWYTLDGDYQEEWERKGRWKVFPVIPIPLPNLTIFSGRQFAILASLALLQTRSAPV